MEVKKNQFFKGEDIETNRFITFLDGSNFDLLLEKITISMFCIIIGLSFWFFFQI